MANLDVSKLEAFIFDLDGVIWRGDQPVEGAVEAIAHLQASGKRCTYCTNNASSTPADYVEKLAAMGISAQEDDIMTSAWATALYLSSQLTGQFSAYVVGEEGLVSMLRKTGARVVTMQGMNPITNDIIEDTAFPVDCVIAGIDRSFTYDKLRLAQRFIANGARFIATNRDATFPVPDGVVPGAGAIVSAIETASGVSPLTIGKPQALMPMLLMQKFDLNAETTAFVGDRLDTDMVAAHRASLRAVFVTTGVSTRENAERARGQQKPDAIFDNLSDLTRAVLGVAKITVNADNLPAVDEAAAPKIATPEVETQTAPIEAATVEAATEVTEAAPNNGSAAAFVSETTENAPADAPTETPLETPTETKTSAPESPLAKLLDDEPKSVIEVEPATSPFAFTLDEAMGGSTAPRPAPHLASPGLSKTADKPASKTKDKGDKKTQTATDEAITPGKSNPEIDVSEGLDNWWESIEDAFKKS